MPGPAGPAPARPLDAALTSPVEIRRLAGSPAGRDPFFCSDPEVIPSVANSKQAAKRARQNQKRRLHNMALRSKVRTYIKKVRVAIDAGDKAAAEGALKEAQPVIDSMVNKGIMHKNKAARHKSRLSRDINAL